MFLFPPKFQVRHLQGLSSEPLLEQHPGSPWTGTDKKRQAPTWSAGRVLAGAMLLPPGEQTLPPASGLLGPAGLSHWLSWRSGSGRGCVSVCAPQATAASLHQDALLPLAGSAHWLARLLSQRSAGDGFLCPLPPRRPHPPGPTSFAVI